jgi:hypothetical protein
MGFCEGRHMGLSDRGFDRLIRLIRPDDQT